MLPNKFVRFVVIFILNSVEKTLALVGQDRVERSPPEYYEVSIQYKDVHICTGTAIAYIYALTTASCMCTQKYEKEYLRVKGGSNKLSSSPASYLVYNVLCQDKSSSGISTVVFNRVGKPIPSLSSIKVLGFAAPPTTGLTLTGWNDNNLEEVIEITLMSSKVCAKIIGESKSKYFICSISPQYTNTPGDEGMPLVYQNTVVGIFAWRTEERDAYGYYVYVYIKLAEKVKLLKRLKSKHMRADLIFVDDDTCGSRGCLF